MQTFNYEVYISLYFLGTYTFLCKTEFTQILILFSLHCYHSLNSCKQAYMLVVLLWNLDQVGEISFKSFLSLGEGGKNICCYLSSYSASLSLHKNFHHPRTNPCVVVGGGGGSKVSLVLALVQHTRIWALDLDLDQDEKYCCGAIRARPLPSASSRATTF